MESFALGVSVPAEHAGRVIGKAGAGLKQIRTMSSCEVKLHQDPDPSGARRCDISGPTIEHMASAVHALSLGLFMEGEPECTMTLLLPASYVGGMIGKGGEGLKRIRESTGIKLQIERTPPGAQGDRMGTMTGAQNQLGAAVRVALGNVGSQPAPQQMGGMVATMAAPRGMQQMMQPYYSTPAMMSSRVPGAALSQVRPSRPGELQFHFVIPGTFIGAVIGKEGQQIKQVQADSGCKFVSATKRDETRDRRVVIIGGFEEAAHAQRMVFGYYQKAAAAAQNPEEVGEVTVILMVPQASAGAIIGKEGANLKRLREQSGIKIKLERDKVEDQRPCIMTGPLENIIQLEKELCEQVMEQMSQMNQEVPNNIMAKRGQEDMWDGGYQQQPPVTGFLESQAKRPRTFQAGPPGQEGVTKLLVPRNLAGAIIGKQGATLKAIRESVGCNVQVTKEEEAPQFRGERLVILKGDKMMRQQALERVLQAAYANEQDAQAVTLKLMVPSREAGGIIGKAGANLKAIREQSGTNVQVEREPIFDERCIHATGPLQNILSAAALVLDYQEAPAPPKQ